MTLRYLLVLGLACPVYAQNTVMTTSAPVPMPVAAPNTVIAGPATGVTPGTSGPRTLVPSDIPALPQYVSASSLVGTDTGVATASIISTTAGTLACSDANGGLTTTGCLASGTSGGVTSVNGRTGVVTGLFDNTSTTGQTISGPVLAPVGSSTAPSYSFSGASGDGWWQAAVGDYQFNTAGTPALRVVNGNTALVLPSTWGICWGSTGVASPDTCLWRHNGHFVDIGNNTAKDASGFLRFSHLVSSGSAPTLAAGAGAGAGATTSIAGTDISFEATVTTAGTPISGTLATVTFAQGFTAAPHCALSQNGGAPLQVGWTTSTTAITVTVGVAPSGIVKFDAVCAQ